MKKTLEQYCHNEKKTTTWEYVTTHVYKNSFYRLYKCRVCNAGTLERVKDDKKVFNKGLPEDQQR
jgi:hypothetical protein|tara:strand:+ start:4875 stop:5069 length:195 start_codon:yes stop_codon:yes gene_type:complete